MLQAKNIGAVSTARPLGINFPALLIALRQKFSTKLEWGTLVAFVVDTVLAIGWQDNNFVLGLSTIHLINDYVMSMRSRPPATLTNATTARKVFGGLVQMELEIPCFINNYNYHMNSVDLANQFRQVYNTQQIAYQIQIPLFYQVLDQAAINAYKLGVVGKTWTKGHLEFRRSLYTKLLASYKIVKPRLQKDLGPHNWEENSKR